MCALSCLECCLAIQGTVPEDPVEGSNSSNSRGEGGGCWLCSFISFDESITTSTSLKLQNRLCPGASPLRYPLKEGWYVVSRSTLLYESTTGCMHAWDRHGSSSNHSSKAARESWIESVCKFPKACWLGVGAMPLLPCEWTMLELSSYVPPADLSSALGGKVRKPGWG